MNELKIIQEKENPLFKRKEIQGTIDSEITPNHIDMKKLISEKFSTPLETIKLKNIYGKFGSKTFEVSANIYASKQDKENIEIKTKREKKEDKPVEVSEEVINEPIKEDKPVEVINEPEEEQEPIKENKPVEANKEVINKPIKEDKPKENPEK